jgi:hypothetical protein
MWKSPPLAVRSWTSQEFLFKWGKRPTPVITELFVLLADRTVGLLPSSRSSTNAPPVTFVNEEFDKYDEANWGFAENEASA